MKIDSLNSSGAAAPSGPRAKPKPGTAASAGSTTVASADVTLSSASSATGGEEPVNTARVQEIRQAIADGRFQINAGAIADRLIESARELVQTQHKA